MIERLKRWQNAKMQRFSFCGRSWRMTVERRFLSVRYHSWQNEADRTRTGWKKWEAFLRGNLVKLVIHVTWGHWKLKMFNCWKNYDFGYLVPGDTVLTGKKQLATLLNLLWTCYASFTHFHCPQVTPQIANSLENDSFGYLVLADTVSN